MNKNSFLKKLSEELRGIPEEERYPGRIY